LKPRRREPHRGAPAAGDGLRASSTLGTTAEPACDTKGTSSTPTLPASDQTRPKPRSAAALGKLRPLPKAWDALDPADFTRQRLEQYVAAGVGWIRHGRIPRPRVARCALPGQESSA
jgi:hypothetical protein